MYIIGTARIEVCIQYSQVSSRLFAYNATAANRRQMILCQYSGFLLFSALLNAIANNAVQIKNIGRNQQAPSNSSVYFISRLCTMQDTILLML